MSKSRTLLSGAFDQKYVIINHMPLVRSLEIVFPKVWRATPINTQLATN